MTYNPNVLGVNKVSFNFASPSPMLLGRLGVGSIMSRVILQIEVPFDDPSATILVGTSAFPSMFMGDADSSPNILNQYHDDKCHYFAVADFLLFTINPGASTTGSGNLFYEVKLAR